MESFLNIFIVEDLGRVWVSFFGRIQDWIFDPISHGFVTTKETKTLKMDFFALKIKMSKRSIKHV